MLEESTLVVLLGTTVELVIVCELGFTFGEVFVSTLGAEVGIESGFGECIELRGFGWTLLWF